MNRTLLLLVIAVVVVGLAIVVTRQNQKPTSDSSLGTDRLFRLEDIESIGKIFLAHRDGETVTLERKGSSWIYNGQYKARQNAMDNLLHAIGEIRMKYKPADAAVQNMVEDLAAFGIKVMIYDRKGKVVKTYYVGGGTADERGTHVIMEGSDQPYVAHLPNWEGNLRFRYNLKGDDWRDKSVFNEDYQRIARISVEYPRQKDKSFIFTRSGNTFTVKPFYPTTPAIERPVAAGRAQAYLYAFESKGAEAFENDNPRRDSIQQTLPFSIISIQRNDDTIREVRLWPVRPLTTVWNTTEPTEQKPIERYFAGTDQGDFFLVQHRVFKDLLMAYPYFFAEAE